MTTNTMTFDLGKADGTPLVGAPVSARLKDAPLYTSARTVFGGASAVTDENGRAVLTLIPSDTNQPSKYYVISIDNVEVHNNFPMPRADIVWRNYIRTGQPPAEGITPPTGGGGVDEADVDGRIDTKVEPFALKANPTTDLPLTKLPDNTIEAGAGIGVVRNVMTNGYIISAPGTTTFTSLTDVPNDYTGQAGKIVRVTSNEHGMEFTNPPAPWAITGDTTQIPDTKYTKGVTAVSYTHLTLPTICSV